MIKEIKIVFNLEYNPHGSWGRHFSHEVPFHYAVKKVFVDGKQVPVADLWSMGLSDVSRKLANMVTRRWSHSRRNSSFMESWDRYVRI